MDLYRLLVELWERWANRCSTVRMTDKQPPQSCVPGVERRTCGVEESRLPGDTSKTFIFTHGTLEGAAREISQKQVGDGAFFVCDVQDIIRKVELWRQCLPRVTPFYAVKACGDPVVLATLKSHGVHFDCSNKNEIRTILNMGVEPRRIIYANTVKSTQHIEFAKAHGVTLMTFDCTEELYKVKGKNIRLLLRVMSDEDDSSIPFNQKFGCSISEARHILETARDLGCNVVGVSFHVGVTQGIRKPLPATSSGPRPSSTSQPK